MVGYLTEVFKFVRYFLKSILPLCFSQEWLFTASLDRPTKAVGFYPQVREKWVIRSLGFCSVWHAISGEFKSDQNTQFLLKLISSFAFMHHFVTSRHVGTFLIFIFFSILKCSYYKIFNFRWRNSTSLFFPISAFMEDILLLISFSFSPYWVYFMLDWPSEHFYGPNSSDRKLPGLRFDCIEEVQTEASFWVHAPLSHIKRWLNRKGNIKLRGNSCLMECSFSIRELSGNSVCKILWNKAELYKCGRKKIQQVQSKLS